MDNSESKASLESASLQVAIATRVLSERPSREPDHARENEMIFRLLETLGSAPDTILPSLTAAALEACRAESAGISLLEPNGRDALLRWHAVVGELARREGRCMPRWSSPSGIVIDSDAVQLFQSPARYFPEFEAEPPVRPAVRELLLAPLHIDQTAVGALWVMQHSVDRVFDREDARRLMQLGRFAGLANRTHRLRLSDEALRASDEHARHRIELMPQMTWTADPQGRVLGFHSRWLELTGMSCDEALADGWIRAAHPDDREMIERTWARSIRTASECDIEYRIRVSDGSYRWLHSRAIPWRDADGRTVCWYGTAEDITSRKEAEERLAQREAQLALATRIAGLGIFDHDHRADKLYWSGKMRDIHKLAPGLEPSLEALRARLHPEDRKEVMAAVRASHDPAGSGTFERDYRIVRSDGEVRWIVCRAQTFFEGEGVLRHPVRTVGAQLDVTDEKHIEMDLRAERERLRLALDAAAAGAFDWNPQTREVQWTDGHYELLGLAPGSAPASYELWSRHVHPEDLERAKRAVREALVSQRRYRDEYRIIRADGAERWVEVQGLTFQQGGRSVRMVGVIIDVTERRLAETRLLAAQSALREADRRKDEFLATLAHELRNPLAPIRHASQALNSPQLTGAQANWARQVIHRQVEHMARLLDDLLDVARITRGKLEIRKEPVALSTIIDTAVETARPLIDERRHTLAIELPARMPTVEADAVRLAQVLSNLLTNAAKYTDPGGRIELTARVETGSLSIRVRDTGIGLTRAELATVFEMFSQSQDAHSRSQGGLGIGLALVKGLVRLHGGSVSASSEGPGHGSEFAITLPLDVAGAEEDKGGAHGAEETPRSPSGTKILVADDNQDAADSLAMLLRLAGHEVRVATNGRAALALANAFRPSAALLDIGMPKLNGYEVARALRSEPWGKNMRLIALTGWGQEEDKRQARAAGFDHHLTKPVGYEHLQELLGGPDG
ncbi:MAG TPA: PAS domain-containing protein [Steroidobacteraceae bacterium]|nr:PAS domain-containing protein [Steroidobacteraceae bacterium]